MRVKITHKSYFYTQSVVLTRLSVITLVHVEITVVSVNHNCAFQHHTSCGNYTLRVEITLCVWKFHSTYKNHPIACWNHTLVCWNHTMRVEITLLRVEITFVCDEQTRECNFWTHSVISTYVPTSHSACRNHSCVCWNYSRKCRNHICALKITLREEITLIWVYKSSRVNITHYACEHHTVCVSTLQYACEHYTMRVNITLSVCSKNLLQYNCWPFSLPIPGKGNYPH
jgi:hypothetical protein